MAETDAQEPAVIHDRDGVELSVTLLEVVDGAAPRDEEDVPSNARLVGARVRVENTGALGYDDDIGRGALLIDASDQQYEPTWIKIASPVLNDVRLEPGDRRAGTIPFLIPRAEEPASLILSLDGGHGPDRALWQLVP
jgi:hypothetical protein